MPIPKWSLACKPKICIPPQYNSLQTNSAPCSINQLLSQHSLNYLALLIFQENINLCLTPNAISILWCCKRNNKLAVPSIPSNSSSFEKRNKSSLKHLKQFSVLITYPLFLLGSSSSTLGFQDIKPIAKSSWFSQVKPQAGEYKDESTQEDEVTTNKLWLNYTQQL